MLSDEEFAVRMRVLRGDAPLKRTAPWQQLMDISIANVRDMIYTPGIADNEGNVEPLQCVSFGEATADTGAGALIRPFVVSSTRADYGAKRSMVEKTVRSDGEELTSWLVQQPGADQFLSVEFCTSLYENTVRLLLKSVLTPHRAIQYWQDAFDAGLLRQGMHPRWRHLAEPRAYGWQVTTIECPKGEDRAVFTLRKEAVWIDHDGKLATPWGAVDSAYTDPMVISGSSLERLIEKYSDAMEMVDSRTCIEGLQMPSYDRARVASILAAQTVLVEVPLAP